MYMTDRIKNDKKLTRHVGADPAHEEAIIDAVIRNPQGMFLLAQLHVESLSKKRNPKEIKEALKILPRELKSTKLWNV